MFLKRLISCHSFSIIRVLTLLRIFVSFQQYYQPDEGMDACLVVPAGLVVGSDGKLGKCLVSLSEISNCSRWLGDVIF